MKNSVSTLLSNANPEQIKALKDDLSSNRSLQTPRLSVPTLSGSSSGKIRVNLPGKVFADYKDEIYAEILGGYPTDGVARSLFLKSYEASTTSTPDCFSRDGVIPSGMNPVADSCQSCPKSAWGSGPNGKGKACRESKILIVNVEDTSFDQTIFELRVSGQSLKNLDHYVRQCGGHQLPIWALKTKISLLKDSTYPIFQFSPEGLLSDEEARSIKKLLETEDIKRRLAK